MNISSFPIRLARRRHAFVIVILVACCLVPAATWGYVQFFLVFAGVYLLLNGSLLVFVRSDDERKSLAGAADAQDDALEAQLLDDSKLDDIDEGLKNWSWYDGIPKYE